MLNSVTAEETTYSPAVQMLLGIAIVTVADAALAALFFFLGTAWNWSLGEAFVFAAFNIGFIQWLYVFPAARKMRHRSEITGRAMFYAAGVLTLLNLAAWGLLGLTMNSFVG